MKILILNSERRSVQPYLFVDLESKSNVVWLKDAFNPPNSKIIRFLHRLYCSRKLNSILKLPFKNIWNSCYPIKQIEFLPENEYYLLFTDTLLTMDIFKDLKKHSNVHICLLALNPMFTIWWAKEYLGEIGFERIFSVCHEPDIVEYNTIPIKTIYSKMPPPERATQNVYDLVENDIYYIGIPKDRADLLCACKDAFLENGVNCDMKIIPSVHTEWMPYPEVVHELQNANCILEVMQGGQKGWTLRTFEAIVYNKKLLTNNPYITQSEYYDPRYIRYFEKVEDIDMDWVKERIDVDYGYHGEFSPRHFLDEILLTYKENEILHTEGR